MKESKISTIKKYSLLLFSSTFAALLGAQVADLIRYGPNVISLGWIFYLWYLHLGIILAGFAVSVLSYFTLQKLLKNSKKEKLFKLIFFFNILAIGIFYFFIFLTSKQGYS